MNGKKRTVEYHLHIGERNEMRELKGVVYVMKSIEDREQNLGEPSAGRRKYVKKKVQFHI